MIPTAIVTAIVTVVRDDLPGLLATRESLRLQTGRGFLWIVVDGASGDGTAAWLADHAGEIAWWRSAPDQGPYDAMNAGLDAAMTLGASHVLFLNAGDRLAAPNTVERLQDAASETPQAAFLYGDSCERLADRRFAYKRARSHRRAARGMFTHHQAILYRCAAVGDLRFDLRYRVGADYALTLALLGRDGGDVRYLPFPVCIFGPAGLSRREAALGRREQASIRRELLGFGTLRNGMIAAVQWAAARARTLSPAIYAKLRFRSSETLFLSHSVNPNP